MLTQIGCPHFRTRRSSSWKVRDHSCGCCAPLPCAFIPVIWMNDVEVGQPGQVLCRVPEHVRQRRVHLAEATREIRDRHSERTLLENLPEPLLALAERCFRALSVRNVPPVEADSAV